MMKTQNPNKKGLSGLLSTVLIIFLCLFSVKSFCQDVVIVCPSANSSYNLPDPEHLLSTEAVKDAIVKAELAGKALNADAGYERVIVTGTQDDLSKSLAMKNDYLAALDSYKKNGHEPYMVDYNNYNPDLAKYNEALARHNTATDESNALAPQQRNANTVATLNNEKAELDTWKSKLITWKANLDAAKAKLDDQREALIDQKNKCETAYLVASYQLKVSKLKLKSMLDQLVLCSYYTNRCNKLLEDKFKYSGTAVADYFGSSVYQGSLADLNSQLDKFKILANTVWEAN